MAFKIKRAEISKIEMGFLHAIRILCIGEKLWLRVSCICNTGMAQHLQHAGRMAFWRLFNISQNLKRVFS